jgi:cytochrome b involved in lipid metabolism
MGVSIIGERIPLVTVASAAIHNDVKKSNGTAFTSSPVIADARNEIDTTKSTKVSKNAYDREKTISRWGRLTNSVMIAAVAGYMIYKDQCLNIFLLCGRIIHLLFYPIVSLRDIDAPTNKPTTVEYNVQTQALVGLLCYTIALLLLWTNESNPLVVWFASFSRTQQYMALSVAAGYENNDKIFSMCCCRPFDFSSKKVADRVYQELSLPISLVSLLVLQNVNELVEYNTYITLLSTAFFAYRMSILLFDYQLASATKTETYPKEMIFTEGIKRDFATDLNNSLGHENVWRIYGNLYDVSDFVKHHPGGVESIMLGANREDCTALFQSYHAFSIHKAKAVLEKYRISPKTSLEDDKKLAGSYTVGHHNDLFYEELVKRVSKKLRENGIDPVKDRYASWGRYFVYTIVLSCIVVSGYYHLTVSSFSNYIVAKLEKLTR